MMSFDDIKDSVICKVVNTDNNKDRNNNDGNKTKKKCC